MPINITNIGVHSNKTIDANNFLFEKKDDYATRDHVRTAYAMIG